QIRKTNRRPKKPDVQITGAEQAQLLGARQVEERKLDSGKSLAKASKNTSQPRVCHRGDDAQSDCADQARTRLTSAFFRLVCRRKHAARFFQKNPSRRRKSHLSRCPLEEFHSQFYFKSFNLRAQRRLRDAKTLGGGAK